MVEINKEKRSVLFFDLQNTGNWTLLSPQEKSEVNEHCHGFFVNAVQEFNCEDVLKDSFRGDDGIAIFKDEIDCVRAGIEFCKKIPQMIRRTPHIEHTNPLSPRIIAFTDTLSGSYQGSYSGMNLEDIIPAERDFAKAGAFRIVGKRLFWELKSHVKQKFDILPGKIKGKRGLLHEVYEFKECYNTEQIRKRYLPPYIPHYQEQLHKFYSSNLAARNGLTECMTMKLAEGENYTRKEFTDVVLQMCRAYFELTVSSGLPNDENWKFKLSYWIRDQEELLKIFSYCYPKDISCHSYHERITVGIGENVVGMCWELNETVVMSTSSDDYKPLHSKRASEILAIAAFPVLDPITKKMTGVLSVDTRIENYFSGKTTETYYLSLLLSSFTRNLALANYLQSD